VIPDAPWLPGDKAHGMIGVGVGVDVVGRLLPGLGIPFDGLSLVSRVACFVSAAVSPGWWS